MKLLPSIMLMALPLGATLPLAAQHVSAASSLSAGEALAPSLPAEEVHIRTGIIILGNLYKAMAQVQDEQSAQAAVPTIVRITRELHAWAQGVSSLPPLSDEMRQMYETRYLPIIRQLNDHLSAQGERLAASEYFGSQDLSTALVSLYCSTQ